MNCFEFRRHFTIDPRSQDAELLLHKHECPACAGFVEQQARFEERLAEALHVDVPAELNARLVLNQSLHQSRRIRTLAIAATVLLTVALAGGWWLRPFSPSLDQTVLAHIEEERDLLTLRDRVSDASVAHLSQTVGMPLQNSVGEVRHVGICTIGKHRGGHLILAGMNGPVTVLLLPGEPVARRKIFEGDGLQGVLVPTGRGGMAIVGEPGEALDKIEQRLLVALHG
jgi:hypothetical protein